VQKKEDAGFVVASNKSPPKQKRGKKLNGRAPIRKPT
jgi:hypothetical protein